jgi:hypothetical protein
MDNTCLEGSAAWGFGTAERIVALATGGRVWVSWTGARESRNDVVTLTAGPGIGPRLGVTVARNSTRLLRGRSMRS